MDAPLSKVYIQGVLNKLKSKIPRFTSAWNSRVFTLEEHKTSSHSRDLVLCYYASVAETTRGVPAAKRWMRVADITHVNKIEGTDAGRLLLAGQGRADEQQRVAISSHADLSFEIYGANGGIHYYLLANNRDELHMWVSGLQIAAGLPQDCEWPMADSTKPPVAPEILAERVDEAEVLARGASPSHVESDRHHITGKHVEAIHSSFEGGKGGPLAHPSPGRAFAAASRSRDQSDGDDMAARIGSDDEVVAIDGLPISGRSGSSSVDGQSEADASYVGGRRRWRRGDTGEASGAESESGSGTHDGQGTSGELIVASMEGARIASMSRGKSDGQRSGQGGDETMLVLDTGEADFERMERERERQRERDIQRERDLQRERELPSQNGRAMATAADAPSDRSSQAMLSSGLGQPSAEYAIVSSTPSGHVGIGHREFAAGVGPAGTAPPRAMGGRALLRKAAAGSNQEANLTGGRDGRVALPGGGSASESGASKPSSQAAATPSTRQESGRQGGRSAGQALWDDWDRDEGADGADQHGGVVGAVDAKEPTMDGVKSGKGWIDEDFDAEEGQTRSPQGNGPRLVQAKAREAAKRATGGPTDSVVADAVESGTGRITGAATKVGVGSDSNWLSEDFDD